MRKGSIVKRATASARRTVAIAFAGAGLIVVVLFAERLLHQAESIHTNQRQIAAHNSATEILLADERLTMSANMAAATGDVRWIERYEANIPLIEKAIKTAGDLASPEIAARFDAETREANDRLVELERASFAAIKKENNEEAAYILNGQHYEKHKKVLREGTNRFIGAMLDTVREDHRWTELRANISLILIALAALLGGVVLWRRFNANLVRSEKAYLDAEYRMRELARNDVLTGLPNRNSFHQTLRRTLSRVQREETSAAVLMIDLDRFKPVNDRHGHLIGDLVLQTVAERLAAVLDQAEFRARFGGDEFVGLIEFDSADSDAPQRIAGEIIAALSEPMTFHDLTVQIGACVGIAICPDHGTDDEDILRKADLALYRAKEKGRRSLKVYDVSMDVDFDAQARQEERLRGAIAADELVPYYQPIIDLRSGQVRGLEVLSRWDDPSEGIQMPGDFIPVAERAGFIDELTFSVLEQACRTAVTSLAPDMFIAVNIAPQQFEDDWLAQRVLAVLHETGLPAHRLEVELTENALIGDLAAAKRVISSLKNLGIQIALDDFGTGYSSLCYLSELPFDKIKIDRSFIQNLHQRPENAKIVNAIVGLGRSLGVETVAEGVESEEEAAYLKSIDCPTCQGFLYARPVPAEKIPEVLRSLSGAETELRSSA